MGEGWGEGIISSLLKFCIQYAKFTPLCAVVLKQKFFLVLYVFELEQRSFSNQKSLPFLDRKIL